MCVCDYGKRHTFFFWMSFLLTLPSSHIIGRRSSGKRNTRMFMVSRMSIATRRERCLWGSGGGGRTSLNKHTFKKTTTHSIPFPRQENIVNLGRRDRKHVVCRGGKPPLSLLLLLPLPTAQKRPRYVRRRSECSTTYDFFPLPAQHYDRAKTVLDACRSFSRDTTIS